MSTRKELVTDVTSHDVTSRRPLQKQDGPVDTETSLPSRFKMCLSAVLKVWSVDTWRGREEFLSSLSEGL